jgi:hypothetical protein
MLAKAIDYMLKRCPVFGRFLDDGRICLSNNAAAERAFRNGRDALNAAIDTAEGRVVEMAESCRKPFPTT